MFRGPDMFHCPPLTLASSSERRQDILRQLGIEFEVILPSINEHSDSQDPARFVQEIALQKIKAVESRARTRLVLAADTVIYCKKQIFQKARDREIADSMIQALSGTSHTVYTGICILDRERGTYSDDFAKTDVHMASISTEERAEYLKTEEWQGVAGAYRIQGFGSCFITRIQGESTTVLGLPIRLLYVMIRGILSSGV